MAAHACAINLAPVTVHTIGGFQMAGANSATETNSHLPRDRAMWQPRNLGRNCPPGKAPENTR